MELRHLRYFLAVAEELNFTRAAARVGIAQPPLSKQIVALEHELNVELFSRSKRKVTLTLAGEALLKHAYRIINTTHQARIDVMAVAKGEQGYLSVGAIFSAVYSIIPIAMRAFTQAHPNVRIKLQEMTITQQMSALHDGRIDLGIVREPESDPAIETLTLMTEPYVAVFAPDHPLAARSRVTLEEIAPYPMINAAPYKHTRYGQKVLEFFARNNYPTRIAQEVDDANTIFALVGAGIGYCLVPASFQAVQPRHVVFRRFTDSSLTSTVHLAWRRDCGSRTRPHFAAVVMAAVARSAGAGADADLKVGPKKQAGRDKAASRTKGRPARKSAA